MTILKDFWINDYFELYVSKDRKDWYRQLRRFQNYLEKNNIELRSEEQDGEKLLKILDNYCKHTRGVGIRPWESTPDEVHPIEEIQNKMIRNKLKSKW